MNSREKEIYFLIRTIKELNAGYRTLYNAIEQAEQADNMQSIIDHVTSMSLLTMDLWMYLAELRGACTRTLEERKGPKATINDLWTQ